MGIPQKSLVIGACEIACHYPELSLNDAAGDALQLAEKIRLYGIEENQKKETVFIAACRFVSADKDLTPQKAVEKALRLWDIDGNVLSHGVRPWHKMKSEPCPQKRSQNPKTSLPTCVKRDVLDIA